MMKVKQVKVNTEDPKLSLKLCEQAIEVFEIEEKLFSIIKDESSFYKKFEPLRHPLIFYFGHTAAFYINKYVEMSLFETRVNPEYERMFAVGVDEMDWDDLDDTHYRWPSVEQVMAYRTQVKKVVSEFILNLKETKVTWESQSWVVLMSIEHQKIHFETTAVIMRRIPEERLHDYEWVRNCPKVETEISKIPQNTMGLVPANHRDCDRNVSTSDIYGWDQEYGSKKVSTKTFLSSRMLVSNGQFFEFISQGGYQKPEYWSPEGQVWLKNSQKSCPEFWRVSMEQKFELKTMTTKIPMPWNWPVECCRLEAEAFCNWKSKKTGKKIRLPTQDQYMALRNLIPGSFTEWQSQGKEIGNAGLRHYFSPCPVDMFEQEGFYDIVGNVWNHTMTTLFPYENFQIHPAYQDYTTPILDGRHSIVKGSSFSTIRNTSQYTFRQGWRRHFYQFLGFRYVESDNPEKNEISEIDQSDELVIQALKDHFINEGSYVKKAASLIINHLGQATVNNSLVVGCSVGRLPLELSRISKKSFGIDYTARFFQMAARLLEKKHLKYRDIQVGVDSLNLTEEELQRLRLYQMNPENTDSKKMRDIDLMVIDGSSFESLKLSRIIKECCRLFRGKSQVTLWVLFQNQCPISGSADLIGEDKSNSIAIESKVNYELSGNSISCMRLNLVTN